MTPGRFAPDRGLCETAAVIVHPFEKLSNFRDVGGVEAANGRVVKRGVLYRSEAPTQLSTRDQHTLRSLRIELVCDLRAPGESERAPPKLGRQSAIRVVNIAMDDERTQQAFRAELRDVLLGRTHEARFRQLSREYYRHLALERTASTRAVIELLARRESLPAVVHCAAGKDRTGFVIAVILLAVGVSYERALEDYLLTNDYFRERLQRFLRVLRWVPVLRSGADRLAMISLAQREFLDAARDAILTEHGSIDAYLSDRCSLAPAVLDRLRAQLLE